MRDAAKMVHREPPPLPELQGIAKNFAIVYVQRARKNALYELALKGVFPLVFNPQKGLVYVYFRHGYRYRETPVR